MTSPINFNLTSNAAVNRLSKTLESVGRYSARQMQQQAKARDYWQDRDCTIVAAAHVTGIGYRATALMLAEFADKPMNTGPTWPNFLGAVAHYGANDVELLGSNTHRDHISNRIIASAKTPKSLQKALVMAQRFSPDYHVGKKGYIVATRGGGHAIGVRVMSASEIADMYDKLNYVDDGTIVPHDFNGDPNRRQFAVVCDWMSGRQFKLGSIWVVKDAEGIGRYNVPPNWSSAPWFRSKATTRYSQRHRFDEPYLRAKARKEYLRRQYRLNFKECWQYADDGFLSHSIWTDKS